MQRCPRTILTLLLVVLTSGLGPAAAGQQSPESVGMSSDRLARIGELMETYVDGGKVPGIVTMVARRGQVVLHEAAGTLDLETGAPMRRDSLFRIFSMTKPIVSVGAMTLYEEGRFQLDDPVADHVPELADLRVLEGGNLVEPERPVTIRHLLTHTAGFRYGWARDSIVDREYREVRVADAGSLEELIERLASAPLAFHPGTRWNYGLSTDVLGAVIERVSGQPLDEFLEDRIFGPLEMNDTGFVVPEDEMGRFGTNHRIDPETGELTVVDSADDGQVVDGIDFLSGGAGLVSTASDYMRFCLMMLGGGQLDGARVLGPKTVEFIQRDHLPPGVEYDDSGHFGLGFAVSTRPGSSEIGSAGTIAWGGAAGTIFWIDPAEDLAVVAMIQLMNSPYPLRAELQALTYAALTELGPR